MQNILTWQKTVLWVFLYSIGMAFLESAVVVYLREIYYPYGFGFPLAPIDKHIAITEVGREAATLLMLLAIGFIAGRSRIQRFAYFIFSFAIWDIFYYVFLRVLIGWPESLMTFDVLFLIPTTWVGPVITPVIASLTMIGLALPIIINEGKGKVIKFSMLAWILLIVGSVDLVLAFIWDYSSYMLQHHSFTQLFSLAHSKAVFDTAYNYIPRSFNWFLFIIGELIIIVGIIIGFRKK
jgi:hypothetical protein